MAPNDIHTYIYIYICRTAQLTSRRCILNIYSTNILTEYFKRAAHSQFFFSSRCRLFHNVIFFGSCNIHILNTECAKILKKIPAPKHETLHDHKLVLIRVAAPDTSNQSAVQNGLSVDSSVFRQNSYCCIPFQTVEQKRHDCIHLNSPQFHQTLFNTNTAYRIFILSLRNFTNSSQFYFLKNLGPLE